MIDPKTGEPAEPMIQFHEFLFLLALIAKNCVTTENYNDTLKQKLWEFYIEKLKFKRPRFDGDIDFEDVLRRV